MRVLLIKMSSLGDVVHTLAAVTDASLAIPGLRIDWVIEEAYKAIPMWHPSVERIVVSPLRRWRKLPLQTVRSGEWSSFKAELRRDEYDVILDAQGLLKSAFVGLHARGELNGRSASSAREPAAALLYKKRHKVDLKLTEVEQVRELFARALGYKHPTSPADFGIDRRRFERIRKDDYVLLLHGAAWDTKLWPEDNWIRVGKKISEYGLKVLLPWGSEKERLRSERLATSFKGEVLPTASIQELAALTCHARFVVGLDTGLTHIAIALGVPTVTLYGPSVPVYERVAEGKLINLCSSTSKVVDTRRPNTVGVDEVLSAISKWLKVESYSHSSGTKV